MRRAAAAFLLGLVAAGCTRVPASSARRPPPPSSLPPLAYYDAGGPVPAPLDDRIVHTSRHHRIREVHLPPRVPAALAAVPGAKDPIRVRIVSPVPGGTARRPLVLMSPILANNDLLMCEFATAFTRMGWDAAIVERKELVFDPGRSLELAEEETRLVVMRSRQALDWLVQQPHVDRTRLATFGVSAGAIVNAMLAGADDRFRAHVWIFPGGPLADVIVDTDEGRFRRYAEAVERERGLDRETVRTMLRRSIRTDPVALAPRVARDDVMLFLAARDVSVPVRHGLTLWEALGRPALRILPLDHYTSFVFFPYILRETQAFLGPRLAPGASTQRAGPRTTRACRPSAAQDASKRAADAMRASPVPGSSSSTRPGS